MRSDGNDAPERAEAAGDSADGRRQIGEDRAYEKGMEVAFQPAMRSVPPVAAGDEKDVGYMHETMERWPHAADRRLQRRLRPRHSR